VRQARVVFIGQRDVQRGQGRVEMRRPARPDDRGVQLRMALDRGWREQLRQAR
jgi:hypothetical protein